MSETEWKSNGHSKYATGKLRVTTGKRQVQRWIGSERPDQPVDRSVIPDQPSDRSVYVQQPDAPHPREPRVNWT